MPHNALHRNKYNDSTTELYEPQRSQDAEGIETIDHGKERSKQSHPSTQEGLIVETITTREMQSMEDYMTHFEVFFKELDGLSIPLNTDQKIVLYDTFCNAWGRR